MIRICRSRTAMGSRILCGCNRKRGSGKEWGRRIGGWYNHAVGERAGFNSAKVQTNTSGDQAFDAEARRMGALFFKRQWQGALGIVVGVLFWLAAVATAVVGC